MKRISFEKIVRDKIPELIQEAGKQAEVLEQNKEEIILGLGRKLLEEANEYNADPSLEELADLLEVIHGILYHRGITWDELESARLTKYGVRGGFEKGLFLKEVVEP